METTDINGNILQDGDTVFVIKDLKVKGMPKPLKQGTKLKIRLIGNPNAVDCKIGKSTIEVKSEYLKKAEEKKK